MTREHISLKARRPIEAWWEDRVGARPPRTGLVSVGVWTSGKEQVWDGGAYDHPSPQTWASQPLPVGACLVMGSVFWGGRCASEPAGCVQVWDWPGNDSVWAMESVEVFMCLWVWVCV